MRMHFTVNVHSDSLTKYLCGLGSDMKGEIRNIYLSGCQVAVSVLIHSLTSEQYYQTWFRYLVFVSLFLGRPDAHIWNTSVWCSPYYYLPVFRTSLTSCTEVIIKN